MSTVRSFRSATWTLIKNWKCATLTVLDTCLYVCMYSLCKPMCLYIVGLHHGDIGVNLRRIGGCDPQMLAWIGCGGRWVSRKYYYILDLYKPISNKKIQGLIPSIPCYMYVNRSVELSGPLKPSVQTRTHELLAFKPDWRTINRLPIIDNHVCNAKLVYSLFISMQTV